MVPQILFILVLIQRLHSFSYTVGNVTVDCGYLEIAISNVCNRLLPHIESDSNRSRRSVSADDNADSSNGQEAIIHHPRATQKFLTNATDTEAALMNREAVPDPNLAKKNKIAFKLVKNEEASGLVRSRFRRDANVRDECCSSQPTRQCIYEELSEYCQPTQTD